MNLLIAAIASLGILALSCIAILKVVLWLIEILRLPWTENRIVSKLENAVPSWRLFGQSAGSFDLQIGILDWKTGRPEAVDPHVPQRRRRRFFDSLINPNHRVWSRQYFLGQQIIQMSADMSDPMLARTSSAGALAQAAAWEISRLHADDNDPREFYLYIIIDRGFFSTLERQALLQLGPYEMESFRTTVLC